ncbi:hypothetical protein CRV24_000129 [Beauveria bassiana]|nr:hypothetical protein CRV24_000129 [Beauveria bassiana]
MTETTYALAIITKAEVPFYKIAVGIAQYGRSFAITDPSCRTEECTFFGSRVTCLKGYLSNYEIRRIVSDSTSADNDSRFKRRPCSLLQQSMGFLHDRSDML